MPKEEFNEAYDEGIRPRRIGQAKSSAGRRKSRNTCAGHQAHPDSTSVNTEITFWTWRGPDDEDGERIVVETRRDHE